MDRGIRLWCLQQRYPTEVFPACNWFLSGGLVNMGGYEGTLYMMERVLSKVLLRKRSSTLLIEQRFKRNQPCYQVLDLLEYEHLNDALTLHDLQGFS